MEETLNGLLQGFDQLAREYGPEALELALRATRFAGWFYLIVGSLCIPACLFFGRLAVDFYRRGKRVHEEDWQDDAVMLLQLGSFLAALLAMTGFLVGVSLLFDITNWLSVYDPRIGLAWRIIHGGG